MYSAQQGLIKCRLGVRNEKGMSWGSLQGMSKYFLESLKGWAKGKLIL